MVRLDGAAPLMDALLDSSGNKALVRAHRAVSTRLGPALLAERRLGEPSQGALREMFDAATAADVPRAARSFRCLSPASLRTAMEGGSNAQIGYGRTKVIGGWGRLVGALVGLRSRLARQGGQGGGRFQPSAVVGGDRNGEAVRTARFVCGEELGSLTPEVGE